MTELRCIRGPLDEEQLAWVAATYGQVDPNYARPEYLRHQFLENPFGWSVHVFGVADGQAVGHCCVVPFKARREGREFVAGKLEGLMVTPEFRGSGGGGLAGRILSTLYAFAHEHGLEMLFGLGRPAVTRVLVRAGCYTVTLPVRTHILFAHPLAASAGWPRARRAVAVGTAVVQNVATTLAPLGARGATRSFGRARLGDVRPDDAELVEAPAETGSWTVSGKDAWDWYAASGLLRAVDVPGSRAIVRLAPGDPNGLQLVAWRAERPGLASAFLLLDALRRLARRHDLPTLRYQPWAASDPVLERACRLLGFVRREEVELLLHTDDPELKALSVGFNPFFSVTF